MNIHGKLLGFDKGVLFGWLYDLDDLQQRLVIEIVADDQPIALVRGQVWMQALANIGDGCYGFYHSINNDQIKGCRRLRAKLANHERWLDETIFLDDSDRSNLPTTPLIGYVANKFGLQLFGWAWDPLTPKQAVNLQFFANNRLLGETRANRKMADLVEMEVGNGSHGFEFTLPIEFADGRAREVIVISDKGQVVKGSPLTVMTYPQTIDDYLHSLRDGGPTQDLIALLAKQFKEYQEYLPLSIGFAHFADWHSCFAGKSVANSEVEQVFLIAVTGAGAVETTLNSLLRQSYPHFVLYLQAAATRVADPRILCVPEQAWDATIAAAIREHRGLLSFVQAGDSLAEDALAQLNATFASPQVKMAYSDCYWETDDVFLPRPWFKPDWDLDLFLAQPLTHHAFAVRAELFAEHDTPWLAVPDAWPWLAVERLGDEAEAIAHISRVLYYRCQDNCVADDADIVEYFLPKVAPHASLRQELADGLMRSLQWRMPDDWPLVSVIIPSRDQKPLLEKCIRSLENTDYPALEIIVVDNDSQASDALAYLDELRTKGIKVLAYPHRFNYSAINNFAVAQARGSVLALLNNDIEAIDSDWLKIMVTQLQRPNVGAVGAKLLWPNGMVQHAGVLLGLHGLAGHVGNDWNENDLGYWGYNQLTRRLNAVTAACMLCYKDDYQHLGGLNEQQFPVAFNDVDFCLRLRQAGRAIIWAAEARLWHAESASRGQDDSPAKRGRFEMEKSALYRLWGDRLYADSSYNVNLNLDRYSHRGLAFPPRKAACIQ